MALFNKKKVSKEGYIRREGRTAHGFAWHIQANPGAEGIEKWDTLCGREMIEFSRNNTDMTAEYLIELVEKRKVEHESYFYCGECYKSLTGRTRPKI